MIGWSVTSECRPMTFSALTCFFFWLVLRLLLCHDFLLNFLWAVVIDLLLLQVQLVQVFLAVLGDVALAACLVVAQQQVEHGFHLGDVLGFHLD